MKRFLFCFLVILFCFSCRKWFKDEKLGLARINYTGNQLRTDGFYYGCSINEQLNEDLLNVYFFYRNGIFLDASSWKYNDMEHLKVLIEFPHSECKYEWGIFQIHDRELLINRWEIAWGPLPTALFSGEILNDTTFILHKRNGQAIEEEIYHFYYYEQKPDSTNNYIP